MPYATFSEHTQGIVLVSFYGDDLNDANFSQYLSDLESLYRKRKNLIVIFDGSRTTHLPTQYRQRMGHWIAEHKSLVRESCLLQIYVISSPLMRFVLQGIFLIQKPPVSFKTISNLADALKLAEEIQGSLVGLPVDHNL
ncbi:MAG: hypothetical protein AAFQ98_13055 [Bacteroidota bacterium]